MALAAIGMAGCEGDDGKTGDQGPPGADGGVGPTGPTGTVDILATTKPESCSVCHGGAGGYHQAVYDEYSDESNLKLTMTGITVDDLPTTPATYDVTLNFTITDAASNPVIDANGLTGFGQKTFYAVKFDTATNKFVSNKSFPAGSIVSNGDGTYSVKSTGFTYDPEASDVAIFGYVARNQLQTELPLNAQIKLYDDVASAALEFGLVNETYESAANVENCEACHGAPYAKHGYRVARVEGIDDFIACKVCHFDERNGGHYDWQQYVDDPLAWGLGETPDATKYAYKASVMNDTHMSHIMEFPYPQNGSNCVTCHEGKLAMIFDDSKFTAETCTSCHAMDGEEAWKAGTYMIGGVETTLAANQKYFEAAGDGGRKRAPALRELWSEVDADGPVTFHDVTMDCETCHSASGFAGQFTAYHTGYDPQIYDASGSRYDAMYTAQVDSVVKNGDVLKIQFSSNNTSTKPMVAVSFYGYDTKDFLVSAHSGDGSTRCWSARAQRYSGCTMEYTVGTNAGEYPNPLFVETETGVAGTWEVDLDLAAYMQPASTGLASIPELISSGKVKTVEVSVLPSLVIDGVAVTAKGEGKSFAVTPTDVTATDNYFKGTAAIAEDAKCNNCHDVLGTSFHSPQYGSAGVVGCRNCHVPTSGGSHLEMQSRSIDSYTHAIHKFQAFDPGEVDFTDPVEAARYDMHVEHIFPLFTALACEGCHVGNSAKYDVPDQSRSMPGLLSGSDTFVGRDRAIGTVPAYVTGPAGRACGSCHRAAAINEDEAGELAAVNAHVGQNGYMIDNTTTNPTTTSWVYRTIDKIMGLF